MALTYPYAALHDLIIVLASDLKTKLLVDMRVDLCVVAALADVAHLRASWLRRLLEQTMSLLRGRRFPLKSPKYECCATCVAHLCLT